VEALEGGGELAGKLIGIVENAPEDSACTTTFGVSPASTPPGVAPAALTPRFRGAGSRLIMNPAGGRSFCHGQYPDLGGNVITGLEEDSGSQIAFRVPGPASSGLSITNLSGGETGLVGYGIDNFRYPWGLSVQNSGGSGATGYDAHITPTAQDVNSVFTGLGPSDSPEFKKAFNYAQAILAKGLCYGYGLLSWGIYSDAHGGRVPLGYASSTGLGVSASTLPYRLQESSSGGHTLTHALVRGAVSQVSPTAKHSWIKVHSAAGLAGELNGVFSANRPALLLLNFVNDGANEGHTLLAYDYQSPDPATGEGIAVNVVDPNVPWSVTRPASDYQSLEVHVHANGTWSYSGSFHGGSFDTPVGGGSGSLEVVPHPVSPGGLDLNETIAGEGSPIAVAANGGTITGISYGGSASATIPTDVRVDPMSDDGPQNTLLVPRTHHHVTVSLAGSSGIELIGPGFLGSVALHGSRSTVGVNPGTGAISLPVAADGTVVTLTSVAAGVQRTVSARVSGRLFGLNAFVDTSGEVTIRTLRGNGVLSLSTATYTAEGTQVHSTRVTQRVHGHTRIRRHTPKPKRRKHGRKRHRRH
jgi:hypothetical protein